MHTPTHLQVEVFSAYCHKSFVFQVAGAQAARNCDDFRKNMNHLYQEMHKTQQLKRSHSTHAQHGWRVLVHTHTRTCTHSWVCIYMIICKHGCLYIYVYIHRCIYLYILNFIGRCIHRFWMQCNCAPQEFNKTQQDADSVLVITKQRYFDA